MRKKCYSCTQWHFHGLNISLSFLTFFKQFFVAFDFIQKSICCKSRPKLGVTSEKKATDLKENSGNTTEGTEEVHDGENHSVMGDLVRI